MGIGSWKVPTALVLVIYRNKWQRLQDLLRRRWPDVEVKGLEDEEPAVAFGCCDRFRLPDISAKTVRGLVRHEL